MNKQEILDSLNAANTAVAQIQKELVRVITVVQRWEPPAKAGPLTLKGSYEPHVVNGKVVAMTAPEREAAPAAAPQSAGPTLEGAAAPAAPAAPLQTVADMAAEVQDRTEGLRLAVEAGLVKPAQPGSPLPKPPAGTPPQPLVLPSDIATIPTEQLVDALLAPATQIVEDITTALDSRQAPQAALPTAYKTNEEFVAAFPPGPAPRQPHPHEGVKGAPTGPTVEGAEAPAAPPERSPEDIAAARARLQARTTEQLKHFMGTGSIFARHISPAMMASAKGFLKPMIGTMRQYQEDVSMLPPEKLAAWPIGFYRNEQTKHVQFFAKTPGALIILDALPSPHQEPNVFMLPLSAETRRQKISELTLPQIMRIRDELEATLQNLDYTDHSVEVPAA